MSEIDISYKNLNKELVKSIQSLKYQVSEQRKENTDLLKKISEIQEEFAYMKSDAIEETKINLQAEISRKIEFVSLKFFEELKACVREDYVLPSNNRQSLRRIILNSVDRRRSSRARDSLAPRLSPLVRTDLEERLANPVATRNRLSNERTRRANTDVPNEEVTTSVPEENEIRVEEQDESSDSVESRFEDDQRNLSRNSVDSNEQIDEATNSRSGFSNEEIRRSNTDAPIEESISEENETHVEEQEESFYSVVDDQQNTSRNESNEEESPSDQLSVIQEEETILETTVDNHIGVSDTQNSFPLHSRNSSSSHSRNSSSSHSRNSSQNVTVQNPSQFTTFVAQRENLSQSYSSQNFSQFGCQARQSIVSDRFQTNCGIQEATGNESMISDRENCTISNHSIINEENRLPSQTRISSQNDSIEHPSRLSSQVQQCINSDRCAISSIIQETQGNESNIDSNGENDSSYHQLTVHEETEQSVEEDSDSVQTVEDSEDDTDFHQTASQDYLEQNSNYLCMKTLKAMRNSKNSLIRKQSTTSQNAISVLGIPPSQYRKFKESNRLKAISRPQEPEESHSDKENNRESNIVHEAEALGSVQKSTNYFRVPRPGPSWRECSGISFPDSVHTQETQPRPSWRECSGISIPGSTRPQDIDSEISKIFETSTPKKKNQRDSRETFRIKEFEIRIKTMSTSEIEAHTMLKTRSRPRRARAVTPEMLKEPNLRDKMRRPRSPPKSRARSRKRSISK